MKTIKLLTLAFGLAAMSATPALAAPPPPPAPDDSVADVPPPPPPPGEDEGGLGPMAPHIFKKLGLTADQKAQVLAIKKKYGPKLHDLMGQMKAEREAMGQIMAQHPAVDQARAEHKKMQGLLDQLGDQRFEMMYEMAGVLTPDQRQQLLQAQKDMAERWHQRHHRHP